MIEADATDRANLIVVRAFSQPHEAHLARSALQAAGIDASLADDSIVAADWLYSNAVGGVKVLVPVEDAAAARAVLDTPAVVEVSADGADGDTAAPAACPHCGSHNLTSVTQGMRLLFLSWLLVGLPVLPVRRRTRCVDCGHVFRSDPPHTLT